MMELTDKTVGIWFVQTTPTQDYMAMLSEVEPGVKYALNYRFRYYADSKNFNSDDKKNWYEGTVTGTREHAIDGVRKVSKQLATTSGGKLTELINAGGDAGFDAFMAEFMKLPFVHGRLMNEDGSEGPDISKPTKEIH